MLWVKHAHSIVVLLQQLLHQAHAGLHIPQTVCSAVDGIGVWLLV
jgi:hypothetical protein